MFLADRGLEASKLGSEVCVLRCRPTDRSHDVGRGQDGCRVVDRRDDGCRGGGPGLRARVRKDRHDI